MYTIDPSEADELRAEAFYRKRYFGQLANHHDCRDPDHPGCELCEEDEDE